MSATQTKNDAETMALIHEKNGGKVSPTIVLREWFPIGNGKSCMVVPNPDGYEVSFGKVSEGLTEDPNEPIRAEAEDTARAPLPKPETTPSLQEAPAKAPAKK